MVYRFIDCLKFFFCLCVIAIHCETLADVNPDVRFFVTQGVFRLAVPFFFVASGYFFYRKVLKIQDENYGRGVTLYEIFERYTKRLLFPFCFFFLINIVLQSIKMSSYTNGPFIFKEIIRHAVFYPWGALWFVQACIVGMLLLFPFIKRDKVDLAVIVGVVLYLWALLCNNYFFAVQGTFLEPYVHAYMSLCISARNGLFVGYVYLAIGLLVAKRNVLRISHPFCLLVVIAYIAEIVLLKNKTSLDDSALYITQLLIVPTIFVTSLNVRLNISDEMSRMLRNFSVGMYLLHRPILSFLDILAVDYVPRTLFVVILSWGICFLARKGNDVVKKVLF